MSFFQNLRNKMVQFMYGRNGMDQLNRALFVVYLVLCVLRAVLGIFRSHILGLVMDVLVWAAMIVLFYRMFSKDLYKRREENSRWIHWSWKLRQNAQTAKQRRDDTEHKYFTCKFCKTICRVPAGKGKVVITCPKCGAKIKGKT